MIPTRSTARARHYHQGLFAIALIACVAIVLALAGCSSPKADTSTTSAKQGGSKQATYPATFKDDAGREVVVKTKPQRIVSLAPANTEIVYVVGLGDKLVGDTTYCDYPAAAKSVKHVSDFSGPNMEAIAAVSPDLILATGGVQGEQIKELEKLGASVVVVDPTTIDGVCKDIELVGSLGGSDSKTADAVSGVKDPITQVQKKLGERKLEPLKTFLQVGQDPIYTVGAGTLQNDVITKAGGINVVTQKGFVAYSNEKIIADDPAAYLITDDSGVTVDSVKKSPGFSDILAVKDNKVELVDGDLVSRPGPRIGQGVEAVAKALYPDLFK